VDRTGGLGEGARFGQLLVLGCRAAHEEGPLPRCGSGRPREVELLKPASDRPHIQVVRARREDSAYDTFSLLSSSRHDMA
jgi:hypothetical protein